MFQVHPNVVVFLGKPTKRYTKKFSSPAARKNREAVLPSKSPYVSKPVCFKHPVGFTLAFILSYLADL